MIFIQNYKYKPFCYRLINFTRIAIKVLQLKCLMFLKEDWLSYQYSHSLKDCKIAEV